MKNIIQDAKQMIYHSSIVKYVGIEKIEEAFGKITVFNTQEELLMEHGSDEYKDEKLEGFNRSDGSYLGIYATPHTVIHEMLHGISSEFDTNGHRTKNGLMGEDVKFGFANQINEGATDYLACKISGEKPRHFIQGHKLFSKLEPILIKYMNDPDILMQIYLQNDVEFLKDFLNYFGKEKTFENLYLKFLYMKDEQLNEMLEIVDKNLNKFIKRKNRKEKRDRLLNKFRNLFKRKKEIKFLPEGNKTTNNLHNEFIKKYKYDAYKYPSIDNTNNHHKKDREQEK